MWSDEHTMSDAPTVPADLRFSEALSELESIVSALESGQLDLEESLARYERGVTLLRACQAKLADAEQRVTALMGEMPAMEDADSAPE